MLQSVPIESLDDCYKCIPFPFKRYYQLLDDDVTPEGEFFFTASGTARVRPRDQWDVPGREIHEKVEVERHANVVSRFVNEMGLTGFLAQHETADRLWFRGACEQNKDYIAEGIAYLNRGGVSVDFSDWRGAILLRNEVDQFLPRFLDYPFVLRTNDLMLLSEEAPLAMSINHHLAIVYASPSHQLINDIRQRILDEGILEYPDQR